MTFEKQMGELRSGIAGLSLSGIKLDPQHRDRWIEYLKGQDLGLIMAFAKWDDSVREWEIPTQGTLTLCGLPIITMWAGEGEARARKWLGGLAREEVLRIIDSGEYTKDHDLEVLDWLKAGSEGQEFGLSYLSNHRDQIRSWAYTRRIQTDYSLFGGVVRSYGPEEPTEDPRRWLYALSCAILLAHQRGDMTLEDVVLELIHLAPYSTMWNSDIPEMHKFILRSQTTFTRYLLTEEGWG